MPPNCTKSTEDLLQARIDNHGLSDTERPQTSSALSLAETISFDTPELPLELLAWATVPPRSSGEHGSEAPKSQKLAVVSDVIELRCLPPAAKDTTSRDTSTCHGISHIDVQLRSKFENPSSSRHDSIVTRPDLVVPNYKPAPLRWPFQVLLFLCICGVIGFFEYVSNAMPEPGFEAVPDWPAAKEQMPESPSRKRDVHQSELRTARGGEVTLLPHSPPRTYGPATSTRHGGAAMTHIITARGGQVASPDPSPILPSQSFPNTDPKFSTNFRWGRPEWTMYQADHCHNADACDYLMMEELIPTYYTDDPSWCPVYPYQWYEPMNGMFLTDPDSLMGTGNTPDPACESIMNVIATWNMMVHITIASYDSSKQTAFINMTTDQPITTYPWVLPSTNTNGDVMLPLEVRTREPGGILYGYSNERLTNPVDIFGRKLEPPYVGLYPAANSELCLHRRFAVETKWTSGTVKRYDKTYITPACTPVTFSGSRSISWWKLPSTRPISAPTTAILSTTTSEYDVSRSSRATANPSIAFSEPAVVETSGAKGFTTDQMATPGTPGSPVAASDSHQSTSSLSQSSPTLSATTASSADETATATSSPALSAMAASSTSERPTIGLSANETATIATLANQTATTTWSVDEKATAGVQSSPHNTILFLTTQDADGSPTTVTRTVASPSSEQGTVVTPDPRARTTTATVFNFDGSPKTTITTTFIPKPSNPGGPFPPLEQGKFRVLSEAEFLLASVVPVLVSTVLAALIQISTSSFAAILPFKGLRQNGGALAADSLCMVRGSGPFGLLVSMRLLFRYRDLLPCLYSLLTVLSTVLVPLSSETIQLNLVPIACQPQYPGTVCATGLRKAAAPTRAVEWLLGIMAIITIIIGAMTFRWQSGIATDPWSIASIASFLPDQGRLRELLVSLPVARVKHELINQISDSLSGERFKLSWYRTEAGPLEDTKYGICVLASEDQGSVQLTSRGPPIRKPASQKQFRLAIEAQSLEHFLQRLFSIFLCGVMILILYYENTMLDTPFERFMDSQKLGVRFLFSGIGVVLTGFWDYYFSRVFELQIYRQLSANPYTAESSILISPPSSAFIGLRNATLQRDIFSWSVAMAAVLAKFTPLLLANIPFRNTVTWEVHEKCTWIAVSILSYMLLVLLGSLLVKKPSMAVEPTSIANCLYHICDSMMVKDFDQLSVLPRKERDRIISKMGKRYVFDEITGSSGVRRVGVDFSQGSKRG